MRSPRRADFAAVGNRSPVREGKNAVDLHDEHAEVVDDLSPFSGKAEEEIGMLEAGEEEMSGENCALDLTTTAHTGSEVGHHGAAFLRRRDRAQVELEIHGEGPEMRPTQEDLENLARLISPRTGPEESAKALRHRVVQYRPQTEKKTLLERLQQRLAVEQTILVQTGFIFPTAVYAIVFNFVKTVLLQQRSASILHFGAQLSKARIGVLSHFAACLSFLFYYARLMLRGELHGKNSPQFLGTGTQNAWRKSPRYTKAAQYFNHKIILEDEEFFTEEPSSSTLISGSVRDASTSRRSSSSHWSAESYLLACHPHGIFAMSVLLGLASNGAQFDDIPQLKHLDIRVAVADFPFLVPGMREYAIKTGAISPSQSSIHYNLREKKHSVGVIVGGPDEALLAGSQDGVMRLLLKDRKGFVRQALLAGVDLLPVMSFGENALYAQVFSKRLRAFQRWQVKKMGWCCPIMYRPNGNTIGLAPAGLGDDFQLTMVIGKPLKLERFVEDIVDFVQPDQEQSTSEIDARKRKSLLISKKMRSLSKDDLQKVVDRVHAAYLDRVKELHAKYVQKFGTWHDQNLEIVSTKEARSLEIVEKIVDAEDKRRAQISCSTKGQVNASQTHLSHNFRSKL
eukprot:TRINITY_DN13495_c0_g2_i1.p1 TRINITY_DN13495_c0_g2~~TRINITY_DN13495_c0_g2_i1.p1  ORF type:complete len:624 (+),score=65.87 TRINITY_DN13495_c0_g2_i1:168-2039(+)